MKLHDTTGKQGLAARSKRLSQLTLGCEPMSNSNIPHFRNPANSIRMRVYVISNRNKTGFCAETASTGSLGSGAEVSSFASGFTTAYHQGSMLMLFRRLWVAALAVLFACSLPIYAGDSPEIMPLSQIQPGMKGVAYTIFEGDQIEEMDLVVLGTLRNALGPKQDVILVKLVGEKVERTGVVAGMSGSPVYFDGKLAGALSLKLGIFTKEAIAGLTPIAYVPQPPVQMPVARGVPQQFELPKEAVARNTLPSGSALELIETPLVFSGFQTATLQQFAGQLQSYGLVATQGGAASDQKDDPNAHLAPGDMAGMVLVRGDMSINSA